MDKGRTRDRGTSSAKSSNFGANSVFVLKNLFNIYKLLILNSVT